MNQNMSDSEKLHLVAAWFDLLQAKIPEWADRRDVQKDLRKIASELNRLRKIEAAAIEVLRQWDHPAFTIGHTKPAVEDLRVALDREEQEDKYVCECGYHINDCHCGFKQQDVCECGHARFAHSPLVGGELGCEFCDCMKFRPKKG